jgi:hypothetical protein
MNRRYLVATASASVGAVAITAIVAALGLKILIAVGIGLSAFALGAGALLYGFDRAGRRRGRQWHSHLGHPETSLLEPVTRGGGQARSELQPVRVVRIDARSSRRLARRRAKRAVPDYVRVHVAVDLPRSVGTVAVPQHRPITEP